MGLFVKGMDKERIEVWLLGVKKDDYLSSLVKEYNKAVEIILEKLYAPGTGIKLKEHYYIIGKESNFINREKISLRISESLNEFIILYYIIWETPNYLFLLKQYFLSNYSVPVAFSNNLKVLM
jgi:hypothetical protein